MRYSGRIDDIAREEWTRLAARFGDHNFCQMWDYAAARAEDTGSRSSHAAVFDGKKPVMLCECRIKTMPLVKAGVAYASGGPIMRMKDAGAETDLGEALDALREEYVAKRGLVLRLAPRMISGDCDAACRTFVDRGFAPMAGGDAYRTVVLDLAPGPDELRKGFRQKWRNSLNRSEREGLDVRSGEGLELFDLFCGLYDELLERKGFDVPLGASFYRRLQAALPEEEKLVVTLALKDGKAVAGHVASMLGDTCVYVLGASNDEGLATKAAYLLQWEIIAEARRRGMRRYDLGGVDPEGNPGVYHFKSGLGGREVTAPGPFEAAPSEARKRFVDLAEGVYRKVRGGAAKAPSKARLLRGGSAVKGRLSAVLCFGGEDWWYHNHGHIDIQLMKRFAAEAPVLYVNSIVMRKLNVGEGRVFAKRVARKAASIFRGARQVMPGFHVYSPASLPAHHLAGAREFSGRLVRSQVRFMMGRLDMAKPLVWVACPAACDVALSLPRSALVYQRTDRYEEYAGVDREQIAEYDRKLKRKADVTFYVNHKMMAEEAPQCRRAFFLDHGVDFERFADAEQNPLVPEEMKGLKHPVIGYFGDIDAHIVDVELLEELTRLLPEMSFVFVGTSTVDTGALAARPNVTMVPRRPYELIAHYGKCFDAAIMPWRANDWIDSCNPIKMKEYLALGKPVVSTPFSELDYYDGVVGRATGASGFAEAIRRALAGDSPERVAARRRRVADCTWESRAALALEAIGLAD